MVKRIWIVEGMGDKNPTEMAIPEKMTVGDLKEEFAKKLGVSESEIEVSTNTKKFTDEDKRLSLLVKDGETVSILPRAKAGKR